MKAGKIPVVPLEDVKYQGEGALGWTNSGGHGFSIPGVLLKKIGQRPSFALNC